MTPQWETTAIWIITTRYYCAAALFFLSFVLFFFICSTHNFFTVNIFFRFRNLSHEFAEHREHIYNEKVFPLDAYYAHTAHGQRSHSLSHFMHEILVYSAGEYFDWIAEIYSSLAQSESLHSAFYSVLLPKPSFIHIWERKCDGKYRPLQFIWTPKKTEQKRIKVRHPIELASICDGAKFSGLFCDFLFWTIFLSNFQQIESKPNWSNQSMYKNHHFNWTDDYMCYIFVHLIV